MGIAQLQSGNRLPPQREKRAHERHRRLLARKAGGAWIGPLSTAPACSDSLVAMAIASTMDAPARCHRRRALRRMLVRLATNPWCLTVCEVQFWGDSQNRESCRRSECRDIGESCSRTRLCTPSQYRSLRFIVRLLITRRGCLLLRVRRPLSGNNRGSHPGGAVVRRRDLHPAPPCRLVASTGTNRRAGPCNRYDFTGGADLIRRKGHGHA